MGIAGWGTPEDHEAMKEFNDKYAKAAELKRLEKEAFKLLGDVLDRHKRTGRHLQGLEIAINTKYYQ